MMETLLFSLGFEKLNYLRLGGKLAYIHDDLPFHVTIDGDEYLLWVCEEHNSIYLRIDNTDFSLFFNIVTK